MMVVLLFRLKIVVLFCLLLLIMSLGNGIFLLVCVRILFRILGVILYLYLVLWLYLVSLYFILVLFLICECNQSLGSLSWIVFFYRYRINGLLFQFFKSVVVIGFIVINEGYFSSFVVVFFFQGFKGSFEILFVELFVDMFESFCQLGIRKGCILLYQLVELVMVVYLQVE